MLLIDNHVEFFSNGGGPYPDDTGSSVADYSTTEIDLTEFAEAAELVLRVAIDAEPQTGSTPDEYTANTEGPCTVYVAVNGVVQLIFTWEETGVRATKTQSTTIANPGPGPATIKISAYGGYNTGEAQTPFDVFWALIVSPDVSEPEPEPEPGPEVVPPVAEPLTFVDRLPETQAEADHGVDFDVFDDFPGGFVLARGRKNLANAIARRLQTPARFLYDAFGGDPDYGYDLRGKLNDSLTLAGVGSIEAGVKAQVLLDERVRSVEVTARYDLPSSSLNVDIQIEDDAGPFTLVLSVDELTAQVVLQPAG